MCCYLQNKSSDDDDVFFHVFMPARLSRGQSSEDSLALSVYTRSLSRILVRLGEVRKLNSVMREISADALKPQLFDLGFYIFYLFSWQEHMRTERFPEVFVLLCRIPLRSATLLIG